MARARADLEDAKKLPFIKSITLEECMLEFKLDNSEEDFSIMLPDEYPAGEPALFGGDLTAQLRAGNLVSLLTQAHDLVEKQKAPKRVAMPRQDSDIFSRALQGGGGSGGGGGGDPAVNTQMLAEAKALIDRHAADPRLAGKVVHYFIDSRSKWCVRLCIDLASFLSPLNARALGVDVSKTFVLELQWSWLYAEKNDTPEVKDIFMCNRRDVKDPIPASMDHQVGALKWFLENRMRSSISKNHLHLDRRKMGFNKADDAKAEGLEKFKYTFAEEDFYRDGNENILYGMWQCFFWRLQHCTERCVICDEQLDLPGMKTSVCEKSLCVHSSETYGLGCDLLTELVRHPQVCELLFMLTRYTVHMGSSSDRLNPMCPTFLLKENYPEYNGPLHFYKTDNFGIEAPKNFDVLGSTMDQFPKISELIRIANGDPKRLQEALDKKNPLIFPLMRWMLSSTRVHLEAIDPKLHIPGMGKCQYHLVSSNPAKEKRFRALREEMRQKKGKGSIWVWHGSAASNWHCILRLGLKNYSGTKFMSAGAAFGTGIYTALNVNVSIGFMGSPICSYNQVEQHEAKGYTFICLCEVVNQDDKKGLCHFKYHDGSPIITVQDEDLISTRFVFGFPNGYDGLQNTLGDDVKIPKELLAMIE